MFFSVLGKTQVRFSHTDVSMPDFSAYRREVSQDPNKPNTSEISRRAFTYLMVAGMGVTGLHAGKNVVLDFLSTMSASADVLAMAKIEVDLTTIPEGKRFPFLMTQCPRCNRSVSVSGETLTKVSSWP